METKRAATRAEQKPKSAVRAFLAAEGGSESQRLYPYEQSLSSLAYYEFLGNRAAVQSFADIVPLTTSPPHEAS